MQISYELVCNAHVRQLTVEICNLAFESQLFSAK